MAEAREVAREFFAQDARELMELRANYSLLATKYHRVLLDKAIEQATKERIQNVGRPLN
jgi:hypothetical protein